MAKPKKVNKRAEHLAARAARARERDALDAARKAREAAVRDSLAKGKRDARNPADAIRRILAGEAEAGSLRPNLRVIHAFAEALRDRRELLPAMERLLLAAHERSDLLRADHVMPQLGHVDANTYVSAVCAMALHQGSWLRPPEDWKPQTHNARRQLASLARHLFAKYPVPVFMDSVWLEGRGGEALRRQCWYLHLGAGKSVREADVPITLTRSMAHQFLQAPPDVTALEALRWAQVRALGGSTRLFRAIIATRLRTDFSHDEFWQTVIQFLAGIDLLDPDRVGPIVDYIHARKIAEGAPEPGFTMKGRSITTLLARVEEWHAELARVRWRAQTRWPRSGFREWSWEEVHGNDRRLWSTHELTTTDELVDEGRAMRHCVATYDRSCSSGRMSIWSLRRKDKAGHWRILTIAVDNGLKRIVEARGQFNQSSPQDARAALERWAGAAGLSVGQYL